MQRLLMSLLVMLAATAAFGDSVRTVPQHVLDAIVDDDPAPLPRTATPAEALLPPLTHGRATMAPPTGTVYCPAEYEQNEGMLIRWGSFNDVLTEMTVGITTGDPDAIVYVVVSGSSQQSSATSTLSSAGADMTQVQFLTFTTDSVWIRDYGPRFISESSERAIVDHIYNRPRPNDDDAPIYIGAAWNETVYDIGLEHGGGNFHLFGNGEAYTSELIVNENSGLTEQDIVNRYAQYQNLDLTITDAFPTSIDGTQHIDMWMLPVSDDAVIIGQYSGSSSYPAKQITDATAADFAARGYTVYRTPGWNSGPSGYNGTHYTYTNSVVMNDVVAIPRFGGAYAAEDAQALAVFQQAFPDRQIFTVDCSDIITYAGAIHCIVMHVPEVLAGMAVTPESPFAPLGPLGGPFSPASTVYTVTNNTAAPMDYSVTASVPWLALTNATGTLAAGTFAQVSVSLTAAADALGYGTYTYPVSFTNLTNGIGNTQRSAVLTVQADPPVITTAALPDGDAGLPYGPVQLAHAGGQPEITWSLAPTLDYAETDLGSSGFVAVTAPGPLQGDDQAWIVSLPIDFPFYDGVYDEVRVSANGFINFGTPTGSAWQNSVQALMDNRRIAPLWDDLKTTGTGNGVYIDESVAGEVTFRWKGITYNGSHAVDFAATLRADGEIVFHYGPGNATVTPTVGISAGDGAHYLLAAHEGLTDLESVNSLAYTQLDALPQGLNFSADGVLSGVPTESGVFAPVIRVTDGIARTDESAFTLTIAAGPDATGDFDADGDVDLADFAALQGCAGPVTGAACGAAFNFVVDGVIDAADAADFVGVLGGPQ